MALVRGPCPVATNHPPLLSLSFNSAFSAASARKRLRREAGPATEQKAHLEKTAVVLSLADNGNSVLSPF